jgi:uncharacterized Ntn-hydrolase superfamily protein
MSRLAGPDILAPIIAAPLTVAHVHQETHLTAARAHQGTYSIVALDPITGELGVAVQSHHFSVGPTVPWARVGIGAVATQAMAEVSYGPKALELMEQGVTAPEALARLVAADPGRATRQVAIVDADGTVAAHTGAQCIVFAGDVQGDGFSCQGNMLASDGVWPAMRQAFAGAQGPLPGRLLATLQAAEAAGGDVRGRQSAAILVVPGSGNAWDTDVSLRVEDHPEPLEELARLMRLHEANTLAKLAERRVGEGRHDEAASLFARAFELAPESHELRFWAGLAAAESGDMDAALRYVEAAIAAQPTWRDLLSRLTPEQAPSARAVRERLGF